MTTRRFRWITITAVLVIMTGLSFAISSIIEAQRTSKRLCCHCNLREIVLALQAYEAAHGSLPPAYTVDAHGNPLHSWRTLILPALDHAKVFKKIDFSKPWNDPANREVYETELEVFQCPHAKLGKNFTNYQILVGEDACFLPTKGRNMEDIYTGAGSGRTLILIEVGVDKAVHWMDPTDHAVDYLSTPGPLTNSPHGRVINAFFADGRGTFLRVNTPVEVRRQLISISSEQKPRDY